MKFMASKRVRHAYVTAYCKGKGGPIVVKGRRVTQCRPTVVKGRRVTQCRPTVVKGRRVTQCRPTVVKGRHVTQCGLSALFQKGRHSLGQGVLCSPNVSVAPT